MNGASFSDLQVRTHTRAIVLCSLTKSPRKPTHPTLANDGRLAINVPVRAAAANRLGHLFATENLLQHSFLHTNINTPTSTPMPKRRHNQR